MWGKGGKALQVDGALRVADVQTLTHSLPIGTSNPPLFLDGEDPLPQVISYTIYSIPADQSFS